MFDCKMMNSFRVGFASLLCLGLLIGCVETEQSRPAVMDVMNSMDEAKAEAEAAKLAQLRREMAERREAAEAGEGSPSSVPQTGKFVVDFQSTAGNFTVEVNRSWSPFGADRFYKLVKDGFYDQAGFFRVVPGFMVQFGLAADPIKTAKWSKTIPDDPVVKSNSRSYVTFAKTGAPNSRSGQIFINYADNRNLDNQGFSPFGVVTKGMNSVDKINAEYGESPDQGRLTNRGNGYLKQSFPNLDYVTKATIVVDDLASNEGSKDAEK